MTISVPIEWWAVPTLITICLFSWFLANEPKQKGDYGWDIMPLVRLVTAIIGSLVAWLIWAIFR